MTVRRHMGAKHMVGFTLSGGKYAVAIEDVREIVHPTQLTTLPRAPKTVVGMVDHRGEVVVVVDLRIHFDLNEVPRPPREKWILLRRRGVALVVDQVTHVFGLLDDGGRHSAGTGELQRGLLGVVLPDEQAQRDKLNHTSDGRLTFQIDVRVFEELSESLRSGEKPSSSSRRE